MFKDKVWLFQTEQLQPLSPSILEMQKGTLANWMFTGCVLLEVHHNNVHANSLGFENVMSQFSSERLAKIMVRPKISAAMVHGHPWH